ncbi:hypothetical protein GOZ89_04890 [Agrobacterium vitis]|uniref:hypothetical protein n=1 Tax=Agrobacterium vitis TaxID=373 RepID=UPI0009BE3527|nr:hypothetical protein [Agrobacterium vitis]MCE6074520.1 hypothetical protein [Agrobacterium vitis]MCM2449813.1 hypothetical protein [Agrobacterium vitis]MCM2470210.1 hypothetical protein [Agrobacterium vitis]MUO70844.1 hypothetical protein [Agrobacterium vitis]MUO84585.1 hypothetical protein [Agrobacterium vitis]
MRKACQTGAKTTGLKNNVKTILVCGWMASVAVLALPGSSFALSELQGGAKEAAQQGQQPQAGQQPGLPTDSTSDPKSAPSAEPQQATPADKAKGAAAEAAPHTPVEVIYDISKAPEPVRKLREKLVEAAASGDPERLRALLAGGNDPTALALGNDNGDPIQTIKSVSGDPDGLEVLAIMLDVLSTGFVHVNAGTPEEAYVWPYFAEKPLTTLTPPEKVELLRLVTAGDFENMLEVGNYNFFRIGIAPDGKWKFFTAGD